MKIVFYITFVSFICACSIDSDKPDISKKDVLNVDSLDNQLNLKDSLTIPKTSYDTSKIFLRYGVYKFELQSVIDTSKKMLEGQSNVTDKLIVYQKMIFYKNDLKIGNKISPVPFISQKTDDNESISVLENFIYELGVIEGANYSLFCVKGSGHCNACPEFFAFYSLQGECLWYQYSNTVKSFLHFGNFEDICKKAGIDSDKWANGEYKKVTW